MSQVAQPTLITRISRKLKLDERELVAISIYPITILLGQLIYHSSPEIINNYYTNKHNLLNVLFVKKGWFWTCFVSLYFIAQHGKENLQRSLIRLGIMTLWWIAFTQWFWGLPLMDKVFVWTGGMCDYDLMIHGTLDKVGSQICRQVKGHWKGGHDPSGHVFLLVLGSLVLWFELLSVDTWGELTAYVGEIKRSKTWVEKLKITGGNSSVIVVMLLWLWWWMLLTTSIHFHSFIEQMSGLVLGSLGVLVYTLPRMI